jgi:hypothetical protein
MAEPIVSPSAAAVSLPTGAIIGIVFAALLAGVLLVIVLLAICVPSIRDKIGQSGTSSFSSTMASTHKGKGTETAFSSAMSMDNMHGKSTLSERNDSTSSTSDSSAELRAKKIAERRRTQSMSLSEPDEFPVRRPDDTDDTN